MRVRMAKITSVCVASDSTNHPDRKRSGPAWKPHSMTPKVTKSKSELSGPKKSMKRWMKAMSQCDGRRSCSASTLSVGIASCPVS